MGSIITALSNRVPLVIMPRIAHLGEHRNDHQLATAKHFSHRDSIFVANNEDCLSEQLQLALAHRVSDAAELSCSTALVDAIREFILIDRAS